MSPAGQNAAPSVQQHRTNKRTHIAMRTHGLAMGIRGLGLSIVMVGAAMLISCGGGGGGGSGSTGSTPTSMLPLLWLTGNNGISGVELFGSDGTSSGTKLIKDINPNGNSNPGMLSISSNPRSVEFNGALFFAANDGVAGIELWKSDGSASGTVLVKDINTGTGDSNPSNFTVVGNVLYFTATDSTHGIELWKTDGTTAGTVLVKDIYPGTGSSSPMYLVALGNTLMFSANTATYGYELWKSDGTDIGTVLVKDINSGTVGSSPSFLVAMGNAIYFTAYSPAYGSELWKSDGTDVGTTLVKDIVAGGTQSGFPMFLTVMGNAVYFTANDKVQTGLNVANGTQVWKTDGTAAGTIKLGDFSPPATGGGSYPGNLTAVGTTLYFTAYTTIPPPVGSTVPTVLGTELWKTDGTVVGTVLVKDINPGTGDSLSYFPYFTAVSNLLYFVANDGVHGAELWKSDGTSVGTVMVKDIVPGAAGSNLTSGDNYYFPPPSFKASTNTVYFLANDGTHGLELWKSDGTDAGTVNVIDLNSGTLNGVTLMLR